MKKLEEYIKSGKKLQRIKPVIEMTELKNKIDSGQKSKYNINFNKFHWRKIMNISLLSMALIVSLMVTGRLMNHEGLSDKYLTKPVIKTESNIVTTNGTKSENSTERELSKDEEIKIITKKEISINQDIEFKIATNDRKDDEIKSKKISNWYLEVNGIHMLYMTVDELKKFNIELKLNDTSFAIPEEFINDRNVARYEGILEKFGYPVKKYPYLAKGYSLLTKSNLALFKYVPYSGWNFDDYNKTLFVAYNLLNAYGNGTVMQFGHSPLLMFGDSLLCSFYNFENSASEELYKLYKNKNQEEINKFHKKQMDFSINFLKRLIPVYVKLTDMNSIILWFVPNEEFLSKLDCKISESIIKELDIIHKIENNYMPAEDACKGFDSESFFELCKMSSGAIKRIEVFPNPVTDKANCRIELKEEREININIHDFTGKLIKTITDTKKYIKGINDVTLELNNMENGYYIISVNTKEGEQVIQKIMINK